MAKLTLHYIQNITYTHKSDILQIQHEKQLPSSK